MSTKAQHFTLPDNAGTLTKIWREHEDNSPWWIAPADVRGASDMARKDSIKLSVRADGAIGCPDMAEDFVEIERTPDVVRFGINGAPWDFTLTMGVCRALDKYAGSRLA